MTPAPALTATPRPVRRALGPVLVLLAAVAGLLLLRHLTLGLPELPAALRDLGTISASVFVESFPFIVLGITLSTLVQDWVPAGVLERLLPRRAVPRRLVLSLFGVLFPVCECGNVPLTRGLIQRGVPAADAAAFLLAAPVVNPVTILTTYHAFGWDHGILAARVLGGLLIANAVAAVLASHRDQQALLTPAFAASCGRPPGAAAGRLARSARTFLGEAGVMIPALLLGSVVAGAIQVGLPQSWLLALGGHPVWSVFALMALAFVVTVCSSVDAFFVLPFAATFLPGGLVAFLLFGSLTDVRMLVLLRTTFSARTLAVIVGLVALGSAAIGLAVNLAA